MDLSSISCFCSGLVLVMLLHERNVTDSRGISVCRCLLQFMYSKINTDDPVVRLASLVDTQQQLLMKSEQVD